ncbi:MAG: pilus assembly protein PilZ [Alteromonadaceae bacterium]|nr:MAG: pilus assembly protein PilZ [Alteromonadaceae bacterium]
MRRFIRHPSDIPISYRMEAANTYAPRLRDVSRGGLCFSADQPIDQGSLIRIAITIDSKPFEVDGIVAWCCSENEHYTVGIAFDDTSTCYNVRMIEQICHIEHYKAHVLEVEGRQLNSEDAAKEWVEKYAADFPPTC